MRFTGKVVLFISGILISSFVRADTTVSGGEAKAHYIKEMDSLKKSNPGEYESVYKIALIRTKMLLGRLGYDVGPFDLAVNDRVVSAIKAYEKNRSIPITGDHLAYETFDQLLKDLGVANTNYAYPSSFSFDGELWDIGTVHVEGTWGIVGDVQVEPVQHTTIQCYRFEKKCYAATAIQGAQETGGGYIRAEGEVYEIERWDNSEIVTKPYDYFCTRYVYRINRLHKSVTGTRSTISKGGECKVLDSKELTLKMVDGGEVARQLRGKQYRGLLDLSQLSTDARKVLTGGL